MDTKFIIFVVIILCVIFFIAIKKDISQMNSNVDQKLDDIYKCVDTQSKSLKAKIQHDLKIFTDKIQNINGEYIEQVRKMNDYGLQPITNMSNHYTDSDSNDGKNINIDCLSDVKKKNDSFYMSEDCPTDKFKIVYKDNKKTITDTQTKNKISERSSSKSESSKSSSVHLKHSTNIRTNSSESESTVKSEVSEKSSSSSSQSSSEKKSNSSSKTSLNEASEEESDDGSDGVAIEMSKDIIKKFKNANNKNKDDKKKEKKEKCDKSSFSGTVHSSKYESITLGSSMKKTSGTKKISTKNDSGSSQSDNSTELSSDISDLSISELKPVNGYTGEYLKKIAKTLSIPITLKDGGIRKQLKKDELYDKIKSHLIQRKQTN